MMETPGVPRMSREQLMEAFEEIRMLNKELLEEREQETSLHFPWVGNLGHWYWNIKSNTVTCNAAKITTLGYSREEIPERVPFQFFTDRLHPDDYENTMDAMKAHLRGEADVYETEYRIRTRAGDYKWYYDRGRITQYDIYGSPVFLAGIVFDVTEKKQREEERDPLTQLYRLDKALFKMENALSKRPLVAQSGVLLLDIDHFSEIDKTKGRMFGDIVLQRIADLLHTCNRYGGIAARAGGDEFLLFLPVADPAEFRETAEWLQKEIASIYIQDNRNDRLSTTIGMTVSQERDSKILVDRAAIALCRAKEHMPGSVFQYEKQEGAGKRDSPAGYRLSGIEREPYAEPENILIFAFRTMERAADLKSALHILFSRIARQYGLDEIAVLAVSEDGWEERLLYLWTKTQAFLPANEKKKVTQRDFDRREAWLERNRPGILRRGDMDEATLEERRLLHNENLSSQMVIPVYVEGHYQGNVIYGVKGNHYIWENKTVLELVEIARIQFNAICKKRAENTSLAQAALLSRINGEIRQSVNQITQALEIAKECGGSTSHWEECIARIAEPAEALQKILDQLSPGLK